MATPNFSNFFSAIDKAEKQATIKIKPEIDNSFMGGLSNSLTGQKGKFSSVGKELGSSLTMGMQQQFGMAGGVASSLATALGPVGIAATAGTAALIGLGAASVNAARGWETLMAGVSKTTGAEGAALTQLSNTLLNLSKEMPIAQAEIAKIATVGGTLGVKQSDLPKFVKDTAMASAGWGMSGEEAANSIAGISNAFKVPIADAQKFGSVINTMADNVGGSEKELADFLVRASGIATTFNEGIASTTAFGAVLASINMPMEVAATGLQSMMAYAMAPSSPERLEQWASMMNVTVDQLKAKLEQDLYGTLIESSNAIATVGTETEQQQARIAIWGEGGARVSSGLVGMQDKYTEALKMSNEQLATGSSLAQAFGAQGATVDAKWQKFTNTMSTALIHVGTAALPVLGQVLDTMSGLVAAADDFAATTLPAWAQSTTDLVNETLGMEEDTPEEAAARKAKIARTAEKTVAKVADITGYQSYAEAQASAANLGQGTGNSYVDGLNAALDTGVPQALTDAYLGDALKTATTAAAKAGALTGEDWVKAFGNAAEAGMTLVNGTWVSNQRSASFYSDKLLRSGEYSTFANGDVAWKLFEESKSGKSNTMTAVISIDGTEYTREFSTLVDNGERAAKKIKAEFRDVAIDIPKYIKNYGSDVSDSLSNALSDGVVSFTEKDELKNYLESLEQMRTDLPVKFKAANLDDLMRDVQATVDGVAIKINLDAEAFAISAAEYIDEHFGLYSKMYETGYVAQKPDEEAYFKLMEGYKEKGDDEVVQQLQDIDTLIETGDRNQAEVLNSKLEYVVKAHPELIDQTAFLSRVALADETMLSTTMVQNGHLSFIQAATDSTSTNTKDTVVAINNLANIVGSGGFSNTVTNAYAEGTVANQNLKVAQMAAAKSTGSALKFSTVSASSAKALAEEFGIPGFASGATKIQPPGGLAFVGEGDETEYVFTESQIKGLYPDFVKASVGSMKWLTGEKYFDDYQGARISAPTSYRWSSYPDAPQVQQLHTENMQTAWLSEGQTTGLDMISSEIRDLQLASIGKSQVQPWFARGEEATPKWLSDAMTKLSPEHAATWTANKGGTVPKIATDTENIQINDKVTLLRDPRSDACIKLLDAPYLQTTDAFYLNSGSMKINEDVTLLKDPRSDACIKLLDAPYLSTNDPFYLASGSMPLGGNDVQNSLSNIEDNTKNTKLAIDSQLDVLKMGIFATPGMQDVKGTFSTSGPNDLVTGLSKEGYVVTYDPRDDTCEGVPFNAPDPSLKTTDKKYLGLTSGYSAWKSEREDLGLSSTVATAANADLADQQSKMLAEQKSTEENTAKTEETTKDVYRALGQQYALQQQALSMSETSANALVTMASVGGSTGLYGRTAGSFWGGLSKGGGGGWVGTGASMSGWGAQASQAATTTTSTGAHSVNSGSVGSVQWAEGGFANQPTFGVFGEAGREAFVPISDRQAGLRILPQVMRELGVPMFASGGIVGSGSGIVESFGAANITYAPTINANGLNEAEAMALIDKSQDRFLEKVAKKIVLSKKRRG